MNTPIKFDEIWIGLANVKIDRARSGIADADYAYVTVLGLAKDTSDFEEKVAQVLSLQYFKLLELEEMEKFTERIQKCKVERSILDLAKDLINGDTEVKLSTFHTYD